MANPAYNHEHRKHRTEWNTRIQAGEQPTCPRCQQPITPNQPWDLGHTTDLTHGGNPRHRRPEHRYCNTSAGAQLAHQDPPPSRPW